MTTTSDDGHPTLTELAAAVERESDALRRLAALVHLRAATAAFERATVNAARAEGATWTSVGHSLSISKQAASKRFAGSSPEDDQGPLSRPASRGRSIRAGWEIGFPGRRALLHIRPRQEGGNAR
jgi:hypothetical protein